MVTLEDRTDVMYRAMELDPQAWIYFVSFVVTARSSSSTSSSRWVVSNNLEESKREHLLRELRQTQSALERLEARLSGLR